MQDLLKIIAPPQSFHKISSGILYQKLQITRTANATLANTPLRIMPKKPAIFPQPTLALSIKSQEYNMESKKQEAVAQTRETKLQKTETLISSRGSETPASLEFM
jgi:hypothetical protein